MVQAHERAQVRMLEGPSMLVQEASVQAQITRGAHKSNLRTVLASMFRYVTVDARNSPNMLRRHMLFAENFAVGEDMFPLSLRPPSHHFLLVALSFHWSGRLW